MTASSAAAAAEQSLVVAAFVAAARLLPPSVAEQIARAIYELVVIESLNDRHDLTPYTDRRLLMIGAVRSVAEALARVPSTSDYVAEYKRRRALGDTALPSVSSVVKFFKNWPTSLAIAGLQPLAPPDAL